MVGQMEKERYRPMSESQLEIAWIVVLFGGVLVLVGGVVLNVLLDHPAASFASAAAPSALATAVLWRRYVH